MFFISLFSFFCISVHRYNLTIHGESNEVAKTDTFIANIKQCNSKNSSNIFSMYLHWGWGRIMLKRFWNMHVYTNHMLKSICLSESLCENYSNVDISIFSNVNYNLFPCILCKFKSRNSYKWLMGKAMSMQKKKVNKQMNLSTW